MSRQRISTGIPELDHFIEGGFPIGKTYLLTGDPGTGKSIFCLQFLLSGLAEKEKAVYVAVDEKPADIIEQAASLGWDLSRHIERKEILILDASAYFSTRAAASKEKHLDIEKVVGDLSLYVKRMEATRVVIDPVGPLILLQDSISRIQDQSRLLVHALRNNMATTNLLTCYSISRLGERGSHGIEEYLVAGTIVLGMTWVDRRLVRTLRIEKMRATAVDLVEHEFQIVKGKGIALQASP